MKPNVPLSNKASVEIIKKYFSIQSSDDLMKKALVL
jgi:hypothetical protein